MQDNELIAHKKELNELSVLFEKLCQEAEIPYAIFYKSDDDSLAGSANLSLQEISIIFETFIKRIDTQQLCLLLQLITAHLQERCLNEENGETAKAKTPSRDVTAESV